MKYLIGIDIGTSATKCDLFDETGISIVSGTESYPMFQPRNGWAEENCTDWWNVAASALRCVTSRLPAGGELAGVGLTGQMHSLVMLDSEGEPLGRSVLWCDTRTQAECDEINGTVGIWQLKEITGNPALPGFTLPKLLWKRKYEPELFAKCDCIMLPKDYIRLKLTGVRATECSDASGTLLFDIGKHCWSDKLTDIFGIDRKLLPPVYESADIVGYVTPEAERLTGIPAGTPVAAGAADNAAAAVGTGTVERGKSFLTIGTSGVLFTHTKDMVLDRGGRIHTFCSAVKNEYYFMGVTQAAGLSLQWLRRNVMPQIEHDADARGMSVYAYMDSLAESAPAGSGKLIYLPYLMGERTPYLDADARGMFFGLQAGHTQANIIRSVLEGVGFSISNCRTVMRENRIDIKKLQICGGGAKSAVWRSIFSDILGMTLCCPKNENAGATAGAAILAGVAAGVYEDIVSACRATEGSYITQEPNLINTELYDRIFSIFLSLYNRTSDLSRELLRL